MSRLIIFLALSVACVSCVVEDRRWHHHHDVVVEEPVVADPVVEVDRVHVHPHAEFKVEEHIH